MKYIYFLFIVFISSCISNYDDLVHFHIDCNGENIADDAIILVNGKEYIISNPENRNDDNNAEGQFKEGSEFLSNSICRSNDFSRTGNKIIRPTNRIR